MRQDYGGSGLSGSNQWEYRGVEPRRGVAYVRAQRENRGEESMEIALYCIS